MPLQRALADVEQVPPEATAACAQEQLCASGFITTTFDQTTDSSAPGLRVRAHFGSRQMRKKIITAAIISSCAGTTTALAADLGADTTIGGELFADFSHI